MAGSDQVRICLVHVGEEEKMEEEEGLREEKEEEKKENVLYYLKIVSAGLIMLHKGVKTNLLLTISILPIMDMLKENNHAPGEEARLRINDPFVALTS